MTLLRDLHKEAERQPIDMAGGLDLVVYVQTAGRQASLPRPEHRSEFLAVDALSSLADTARRVLTRTRSKVAWGLWHKTMPVAYDPLKNVQLRELLKARVQVDDPVIEHYLSLQKVRVEVRQMLHNAVFAPLAHEIVEKHKPDVRQDAHTFYRRKDPRKLALSIEPGALEQAYVKDWLIDMHGVPLLRAFDLLDTPR